MVRTPAITPTHPLIRTYHQTLERYGDQRVEHESALRSAFQNLLADSARLQGWTLIPELGAKVGRRTLRPDGTLRDQDSGSTVGLPPVPQGGIRNRTSAEAAKS